MTKERLEELIKQGATIYPLSQWFDEISLNKIGDVEVRACYYGYELGFVTDQSYAIDIELLFETKEERNHIVELKEWKHKTYAERTERFEPPMWEDIENEYMFNFVVNNEPIHFFVNKERALISVMNDAHFNIIFDKYNVPEEILKENYEKACEIVRDLFKGESNGKNS